MSVPNKKMETWKRKTNLQKAAQIQLEMLEKIAISIDLKNKFQALTDWGPECQMQSDVCKGWFLRGSSSQDVGEVTKISTEMWERWLNVLNCARPWGKRLKGTSVNTTSVEYRRVWRETDATVRLKKKTSEGVTAGVCLKDRIAYPFLW